MQENNVSIIIPTCNSAEYLSSLFSFLLGQNSSLFQELLIIDYGSRDSTRQVVARFAAEAFIRFIPRVTGTDEDLASFLRLGTDKAENAYMFVAPPQAENVSRLLHSSLQALNERPGCAVTCRLHGQDTESIIFRPQPLAELVTQNVVLNPRNPVSRFLAPANGMCLLCRTDELKILVKDGQGRPGREPMAFRPVHWQKAKKNRVPQSRTAAQAQRIVRQLRFKLFNLGFTERAYADLKELTTDETNPDLRRLAARELAVWEANKRSMLGAENCLEWLRLVKKGEQGPVYLRQTAILEAECLELLGRPQEAKEAVEQALQREEHSDLYLAYANLEPDIQARIGWINKALERQSVAGISWKPEKGKSPYACLYAQAAAGKNAQRLDKPSRVSVIIPAYNAQETIHIALDSVLAQTWTNLEALVVDDCSQDDTLKVVQEYARRDNRVRHFHTKQNSGPYVARNIGLANATGDLITVNDADDWAHPQKIAIQALHLLQSPQCMANTSEYCRMFPDLTAYRRGNHGKYIIKNFSSLMFRRQPVLERIGYWDCVRFGADADFLERLDRVFGVENLETGPLLFAGQSQGTLTGDQAFGVPGYIMGCRLEYQDCRRSLFEAPSSLYYEFPQRIRPFPVPEPMWPQRRAKPGIRRHFDAIIAADLRKSGQITANILKEIKLLKHLGV
ncbi:MAG: glycosyltransferase, partial [Desulfovermiculus sp.]